MSSKPIAAYWIFVSSFVVLLAAVLLALSSDDSETSNGQFHTNEYLIQIKSHKSVSTLKLNAERFGLRYIEQVSPNVHSFIDIVKTEQVVPMSTNSMKSQTIDDFQNFFKEAIEDVQRVKQNVVKQFKQQNRLVSQTSRFMHFIKRKALYDDKCSPYYGMGIEEAWALNYTGAGVNVGLLDVGVETSHPDLKQNINKRLAFNFVDKDRNDFWPQYDRSYYEAYTLMDHGTNIAGIVAAVKGNDLCCRGVAYDSSVVPLVVFKLNYPRLWQTPDFNGDYIPRALTHNNQEIQLFSNSYNNKYAFSEPKLDMRDSLLTGVSQGRNGRGSIFVFSLGDKADDLHDGNMDFFANSIHTITIAAIAKGGTVPEYAIPCACIIASALGDGKTLDADYFLTTSDRHGCTDQFKGSSAAAGIGAGIIALGLKDKLSWRDVQYILILTSSLEGLKTTRHSTTNGAGLKYNVHFGYGMMNATGFAVTAETWTPVPRQIASVHQSKYMRFIPEQRSKRPSAHVVGFEVNKCEHLNTCIHSIEHVVVNIRYTSTRKHLLAFQLKSPSGSRSYIQNDATGTLPLNRTKTPVTRTWNFTSVQFWGEDPVGKWYLIMTQYDKTANKNYPNASVWNATLYIYGTSETNVLLNGFTKHDSSDNESSTEDDILDILKEQQEFVLNVVLEKGTKNIMEDKSGKHINHAFLILVFIPTTVFLVYECLKRLWKRYQTQKKTGHHNRLLCKDKTDGI